MATLRQVLSTAEVDAEHRRRLIADIRKASAVGRSVQEWRAERTRAVEELTHEIRELLTQNNSDDPVALLPEILVLLEQRILAQAQAAAETSARFALQKFLRKAATS
jgi:hypothetical protein